MNITLRTKPISKGRLRYWIDYYDGKRLKPEILKELWIYEKPKTHDEREHNKAHRVKANDILRKRQDASDKGKLGISGHSNTDLIVYMNKFVPDGSKSTRDKYKYAIKDFETHLKSIYSSGIKGKELTADMCIKFAVYAKKRHTVETAKNYFVCVKRVLRDAYKDGVILFPAEDMRAKFKLDKTIKKANILPSEAVTISTSENYTNTKKWEGVVRNALIFCMNTGFGAAELDNKEHPEKSFRWKNIRGGRIVNFKRAKTGEPIEMKLNEDALSVIGERGDDEDIVIKLPSKETVRRHLKDLCAKAGIPRYTFYCGRHTFGTNLSTSIRDINSLSKLMASSPEYVARYMHAVDEKKNEAIDGLPSVLNKLPGVK